MGLFGKKQKEVAMIFEPFDEKNASPSWLMKRPQRLQGAETAHRATKLGRANRQAEKNPATYSAFYRMVWRWHFYAGLFCTPFIFILSLSGSIYLFKPQIDAYIDRPFNHLTLSGAPKSLDAQIAAAVLSQPGARLKNLEIRNDPSDAARVQFLKSDGEALRVFVRPDTLEILKTEPEKSRFTSIIHDLHGELLIGTFGAILVELAGVWAIIMILTGLYLWWPNPEDGLAGVLYPRLNTRGRTFLKDLHSVTGVWISFFALFFLISALPWTTLWGGGLKYLRSYGQATPIKQEWTTGPASAKALQQDLFKGAATSTPLSADEHQEHWGHQMTGRTPSVSISGFDRVAPLALPLKLEAPVFLTPPSAASPNWKLQSETQNRPQRKTIEFDPITFRQISEKSFSDRVLLDRIIGVGIAAHEGQLFGVFNQILGLMTAIGYLVLVVSSTLMWWRRRPQGALGAPTKIIPERRTPRNFIVFAIILGVLLPTLGASLLFILAVEFLIRRYSPRATQWLGLEPFLGRQA